MKRRRWYPGAKAMIVVQGLKGRPVAEICIEHQINQAQYYQWRDQLMANLPQVFSANDHREKALVRENVHLKRIIGELTLELKKANEWPE